MDINREIAFQVLVDIEKNKAYSNLSLNRFIKDLEPDKEGFIRELVYGVLREKKLLDYYLESFVPSGLKKIKVIPLTLLRMGLYQMIYMDSVPDYAAVNETVNLTKKVGKGNASFVNGVLRNYLRKRDQLKEPTSWETKYSIENWIIELFKENYGSGETLKILESLKKTPALSIRVNVGRISKEKLRQLLEEKGFMITDSELSDRGFFVKGSGLLRTEEYKKGLFSVQDISSIMAADTLDPSPGDLVLDLCAAPGGKTFAMGEKMENRGEIYGMDKYLHKLNLMKQEASRLGIKNLHLIERDSREMDSAYINLADKVLLDAPCSGLGVIRRKPEIKYKKYGDLDQLIISQRKMLKAASTYVKKGGILVYSTCTMNKKENQDQIEQFIKSNKEFERLEERQLFPYMGVDGFFICKMRRKER